MTDEWKTHIMAIVCRKNHKPQTVPDKQEEIMKKFFTSLPFRLIVALAIGIVLGQFSTFLDS